MKWIVGAALWALVSAAAGALAPTLIARAGAEGQDVRCIQVSGSTFCKGAALDTLPYDANRDLGGIVALSCDWERPGKASPNGQLPLPAMARGCPSGRYVVSHRDAAVVTNFWVSAGRVHQIDRYPIEF